MGFTHLDEQGKAQMVDVTEKNISARVAIAEAYVDMLPETLEMITEQKHKKGDVLATARIAGIQAAKKTWDIIPMCHPIMLTSVKVQLEKVSETSLYIQTICKVSDKTGVEMEALTAASTAALTVYDMCKAVDRGMVIRDVRLVEKSGGKSGLWQREEG